MNPISLINKTVKVNNVDDLIFFFPDFKVKRYVTSLDMGEKIIYTGTPNRRAMSILETGEYICTQGLYQYDLSDRKSKLIFVYSKWERDPPNNILESVDLYDDNEFNYCCKTYWVVGRWPYKLENETSIYEFYQASVGPIIPFINKYFESRKSYPTGVVEQSFLTFILRSKSVDEQNVSPQYKRLLKQFHNISGSLAKKAVDEMIDSPIKNRDLRMIEFMFNLRR